MRWLCILLVVAACGGAQRGTDPRRLPVEDTALWFMRAALAGDQATARRFALDHHELALISTTDITDARYQAKVQDLLDQLAREGDESAGAVVAARVIQRKRLAPPADRKLERPVEVAIVQYRVVDGDGVEHRSPLPWLFVKTDNGWKLSPAK